MFNFGAAVDVATDDCLFMARSLRTSEATTTVFFVCTVADSRTKNPAGRFALSDFVNAKIVDGFSGRKPFAHPTWLVATTGPCLVRRFRISKFWMDFCIGSTPRGLSGGLFERCAFPPPAFS